ncbi:ATP-binding protein [Modestobacter lapidis]|nr:ATP-binding protein [Modestobacter lapidis]
MSALSARIDLPAVPRSVVAARRVLRELLAAWGASQDRQDAELLATELVANVVDHVGGDGGLSLEIVLAEDWLRIAVVDGSAVRPVVQGLSGVRPRGRGLQMVAAIATRWGVEDHSGGKRVWFDLVPAGVPAGLPSAPRGEGPGVRARQTEESSR